MLVIKAYERRILERRARRRMTRKIDKFETVAVVQGRYCTVLMKYHLNFVCFFVLCIVCVARLRYYFFFALLDNKQ